MKYFIMTGGLGNQMFQYAYCYSLRKLGIEVTIDTSLYLQNVMHNGYELPEVFNIKESVISKRGIHLFIIRLLLHLKPSIFLKEEQLGIIMSKPSFWNRYIKGEFQSTRYFEDFQKEIRNLYSFKYIDLENRRLAKELAEVNSVSLHIRRGDYVNNPTYSGICTKEYYLNAINIIKRNIGECKFYVFSNDKEWSRSFMKSLNEDIDFRVVDINNGSNSYADIYLMSKCKHNIIVNSSFSWWGAWLNPNTDKIVISPKKWANVEEFKYQNIVPKGWIKL